MNKVKAYLSQNWMEFYRTVSLHQSYSLKIKRWKW